eukprot:1360845-Pyramimonas_sp.AAC.1
MSLSGGDAADDVGLEMGPEAAPGGPGPSGQIVTGKQEVVRRAIAARRTRTMVMPWYLRLHRARSTPREVACQPRCIR